MIEPAIYAAFTASSGLSDLVQDRVFPDTPDDNTTLPFVIYWTQSSEPTLTMTGNVPPTRYTVAVDSWATKLSDITAIQTATKTALNGYTSSTVQRAYLTDSSTTPEDEGYHGTQVYTVWGNE